MNEAILDPRAHALVGGAGLEQHPACAACRHVHRITVSSSNRVGSDLVTHVLTYDERCSCGCTANGSSYDRGLVDLFVEFLSTNPDEYSGRIVEPTFHCSVDQLAAANDDDDRRSPGYRPLCYLDGCPWPACRCDDGRDVDGHSRLGVHPRPGERRSVQRSDRAVGGLRDRVPNLAEPGLLGRAMASATLDAGCRRAAAVCTLRLVAMVESVRVRLVRWWRNGF